MTEPIPIVRMCFTGPRGGEYFELTIADVEDQPLILIIVRCLLCGTNVTYRTVDIRDHKPGDEEAMSRAANDAVLEDYAQLGQHETLHSHT